jgi:uncharacterized protein (UPF0305 family)
VCECPGPDTLNQTDKIDVNIKKWNSEDEYQNAADVTKRIHEMMKELDKAAQKTTLDQKAMRETIAGSMVKYAAFLEDKAKKEGYDS